MSDCDKKLKRNTIGLIIGALVPVIDAIATVVLTKLDNGDAAVGVWFAVALVAYILGGGLGSAIKFVFKLSHIAWLIFPIFPVDIAIAGIVFFIAGGVALFLPVVFILMARHQLKLNKNAAEYLLGVNRAVVTEAEPAC